jgi:tight adherence protein B
MTSLLLALLVAGGLFVAVVASRAQSDLRVRDLRKVLDTYSSADADVPAQEDDELRRALAQSGRLAERAFAQTGVFARVRTTLARSDWTLSPGEFISVSLVAAVVGVLVGVVSSSPPLALLLGALGLVGPFLLVTRSVNRRRAAFEEQLPDVLDLLAASLESGAGIAAALELVIAEAPDPAASEFARVLTATRLGATLVEGLADMADRLDSRDLLYTVQAISVQQRTGGKLAEVLGIVADFMRGRAELRREIKALTAEGRLSAYILGGLPFAIAGFISLVNPDYLDPLYTTLPGLLMLAVAGALMTVSFFFMARIIKIEV